MTRVEAEPSSRQLVRQAVPILDKLLRATRIPGVRGIADDVVALVSP